jgi:hypothetical protein
MQIGAEQVEGERMAFYVLNQLLPLLVCAPLPQAT